MPYLLLPQSLTIPRGKIWYSDLMTIRSLEEWIDLSAYRPLTDRDRAIAILADHPECRIVFIPSQDEAYCWRAREDRRFSARQYAPCPWADQHWSGTLEDHYAHISTERSGMIAYTPDEQYGHEDRQLRSKAGTYLKKFVPDLDDNTIRDYVNRVKILIGTEIKIATAADEIIDVYRFGPSSCMDHRSFPERSGHPCAAYGDSDLAVAYLGSIGDEDQHVSARAVIDPKRKQYVRTYGDTILGLLLDREGYERVPDFADGIRLRAIPYQHGILGPYFDSDSRSFRLSGPYLIKDRLRGDVSLTSTEGWAVDPERRCDHCGEAYEDSDSPYCPDCEEQRACCAVCDETIWLDENPSYYEGIGHTCGSSECERFLIRCEADDCENWQFTKRILRAHPNTRIRAYICQYHWDEGMRYCHDAHGYHVLLTRSEYESHCDMELDPEHVHADPNVPHTCLPYIDCTDPQSRGSRAVFHCEREGVLYHDVTH